MALVTIVGLGPAGPEFLTEAARQQILRDDAPVFLRTLKTAAAVAAPHAQSYDAVYETKSNIDEVYPEIVGNLVQQAMQHGEVVYAVPGSPFVAEKTVALLLGDERVDTEVVASLSFLDLAWAALRLDPIASGVRLIDGRRFGTEAAGERGPLLVSQCDTRWVLSEIKLAYENETPAAAKVLFHLGLEDQAVFEVPWDDLDRSFEPDHLTSIYIDKAAAPVAGELARLDRVARELRAACPWDREQTHSSLSRYLIEESYELLDAIEHLDSNNETEEHLIEELGDVFFQVFAHCAIAAEEGRFNISDVAQVVSDKLIERHPHVYGDVVAETSDDVMATWETNKLVAKGRESLMDGVPQSLPALMYAHKILKKASHADVVLDDVEPPSDPFARNLFELVEQARHDGKDPEAILRQATNDFRRRFEAAERQAGEAGTTLKDASPQQRSAWLGRS